MGAFSSARRCIKGMPGVRRLHRRILINRYLKRNRTNWNARYWNDDLQCLVLSGSWKDIGQKVGLIGPVDQFVDAALLRFDRLKDEEKTAIISRSYDSLHNATKNFPQIPAMLEGLAHGSGVQFDRLVAAHFVTALDTEAPYRSCGAIGALTSNGPVFAQALDLGLTNLTATALIVPDDGPRILVHMNLGSLWFTSGVNSHGLIVGGASVNAKKSADQPAPCFPHTFVQFSCLVNASSVSDAKRLIKQELPFGAAGDASTHLLIDNHTMAIAEIVGRVSDFRSCDKGAVTSHFLSPKMCHHHAEDSLSLLRLKESKMRALNSKKFFERNQLDADSLADFLATDVHQGGWFRAGLFPDDGWTTSRYVLDNQSCTLASWHGAIDKAGLPKKTSLSALSAKNDFIFL